MPSKAELRTIVRAELPRVQELVNAALTGQNLQAIEPILRRIGRGGRLPHWFEQLKEAGRLPNLDGKTIGSVLEMLFVAVLEAYVFPEMGVPPLRVNPARGVDLPDLDLGVKSPSENFCTSEPFFSAYERLLGSEYDIVVLLTDYQTAKKNPPLRLSVIGSKYLSGSQVADRKLTRIMRDNREWLLAVNEVWAKKVLRFLAYVNQSDWRAKHLLSLMDTLTSDAGIHKVVTDAIDDFGRFNRMRDRAHKELLADSEIGALRKILSTKPLSLGVIDAADDSIAETQQDFARLPDANEWHRLLTSPLDGQIGMSFALQWRYNFGSLFGDAGAEIEEEVV